MDGYGQRSKMRDESQQLQFRAEKEARGDVVPRERGNGGQVRHAVRGCDLN